MKFRGVPVLVTGMTGFKGSWLALRLLRGGARVSGLSLAPEDARSLYADLAFAEHCSSHVQDIRDLDGVARVFARERPELVLHLAAQSLVRRGYERPLETFETNVQGTLNVLEAARRCGSVRAVVAVTSDKCYANEPPKGTPFREEDPLGGHDPYSASKAAAEIAVASFRASYGAASQMLIATARAGNVIGGGDWAADRLVPDIVRAALARRPLTVRFPDAVRPWQHVLESVNGYQMLGARLLAGDPAFACAWNFGPDDGDGVSVREVIDALQPMLGAREQWTYVPPEPGMHESPMLRLDAGKARRELGWRPRYHTREALALTGAWYRRVAIDGESARVVTEEQLDAYDA